MAAQAHEDRFHMQQAVAALMNKRRAVWERNEMVAESVAYIVPRLERAHFLVDAKEEGGTSGLTQAKNNFIDNICARSWLMAKRLKLFALRKGLPVLLAQATQPRRYFDNGSELERIGRCAAVVKWAEEHMADLAPFKISMGDVAALSADIERARPLSADRDTTGDGLQLVNKNLPQLLQEIQDKLYELDDEVIALMDDQPEFQDEYFIARRITDRKATRRPMRNE
ncbi:hypothetical protein [Flaviaesturariibacter aridisoli]|uniref:Uncharacterized protein n=1 Tax=Flaviaesturariibacter aridisoli TaxID=2545761 RepID=A0A4R4E8Z6_9BACT|nr:hypothetical protein [Flaviaesturariibacter aridisoli]TCZ74571.1 hypothetical protein E0486_02790 [Flaviaesturariibacter aridisoli]